MTELDLIGIGANLPIILADTTGTPLSKYTPAKQWLLVLGNEAHGPCVPEHLKTTPITVEMTGPVESLNVAQAGAIVLYHLTH